jgi:hypothetical protein
MTFNRSKTNAELTFNFIDTPEHLSKILFFKGTQQQTCDEVGFVFYRTNPVPEGIQTINAPTITSTVTENWVNVISTDTSSAGSIIGPGAVIPPSNAPTPCAYIIEGPNIAGSNRQSNPAPGRMTYIKILAPTSGQLDVNYTWISDDPGVQQPPNQAFDWPFFSVDSQEPTDVDVGSPALPGNYLNSFVNNPTNNTPQSGQLNITFSQGDWISIGVYSVDRIGGAGRLQLTNVQQPTNPDLTLCGMTATTVLPGCGTSRVYPVDITSVVVNTPKSISSLDPVDIQNSASQASLSISEIAKKETLRNVANRLVDAINRSALLDIVAQVVSDGTSVLVRRLTSGISGNTPVYALPYVGNFGDPFGYSLLPEPRKVGLFSRSKYEILYFEYGSEAIANFPYGIPYDTDDPYSRNRTIVRKMIASPNAGTISVPSIGSTDTLDVVLEQHPYAQYTPYDESNSAVSFGFTGGSSLYGTQTELDDDFLMRGSTQGSLDEPLRNKDKIEIDLTPVTETTLLHSGGFPNRPMAYFNFVTKRWEPIGFGLGVTGPAPAPTSLHGVLDTQYLGFSQGWGNITISSNTSNLSIIDPVLLDQYTGTKKIFQETGWFTPIDTYGFPLHPKYHATGSQQLDCELLVDRPFLLEKIVYEFSASMPDLHSRFSPIVVPPFDVEYRGSGGAFFILNQRKANPDPGQESSYTNVYVASASSPSRDWATPQDGGNNGPTGDHWILPYDNDGIPRTMQLSTSGPQVYVDTVRDLVTFARIGTVWSTYDEEIESLIEPGFPHPATFMDLAIEVPATGTFSGKYTVAAPVRAPSQSSAVAVAALGTSVSPNSISRIYASKDTSTRNSIDLPTGRAINGEFFGPEISYRVNGYQISRQLFAPKTDSINSPYLIRPGDRLVFGWQSPTWFTLNASSPALALKLLPGKGKLTLYGSHLQDDKPVHDIFKDQLNSDAAHETIPSGPWALDRFESEPQMVYSSSMREEHVTGTMLTRRSDGTLSVTNVNNLSIGGVRAVSARASSGNLGQRWSLFRNNRLFDDQEQYYDSMLPDPAPMLVGDARPDAGDLLSPSYDPNNARIYLGQTDRRIFTGIPDQPLLATYRELATNREFFRDSFLLERYGELPRVKKINSSVIKFRKFPGIATSFGFPTDVPNVTIGSIAFLTGTISGSSNPAFGNDFAAGGGLQKNELLNKSDVFFPFESRDDTNITSITSRNILSLDDLDGVNYHLSRMIGCYGSGFNGLVQFRDVDSIFTERLRTMIYRGVKHGFINPTPLFSNAVFNGTHFGQFRDLMEQRQYTRFSLNDSSLTDAAVEVVFIDRSILPDINGSITNNVVSGSFTNSSNISPFATSEHPYDDALSDSGLIWDRNTPLPETLIAL